jgi:hypothetical protein
MMERHCALCRALNSLPDIQGLRIDAHYMLGMSRKEIAQVEHVSESSVNESIDRDLRTMKKSELSAVYARSTGGNPTATLFNAIYMQKVAGKRNRLLLKAARSKSGNISQICACLSIVQRSSNAIRAKRVHFWKAFKREF